MAGPVGPRFPKGSPEEWLSSGGPVLKSYLPSFDTSELGSNVLAFPRE